MKVNTLTAIAIVAAVGIGCGESESSSSTEDTLARSAVPATGGSPSAGDSAASSSSPAQPLQPKGMGRSRAELVPALGKLTRATWTETPWAGDIPAYAAIGEGMTIQLVGPPENVQVAILNIEAETSDDTKLTDTRRTVSTFATLLNPEAEKWIQSFLMERVGEERSESKTIGNHHVAVSFAKTSLTSGTYTIRFTGQ